MQYFYDPEMDNSAAEFILPEEEARHAVQVLRKKAGDQLMVTNGKGYVFQVEMLVADSKKCKVLVLDADKVLPPKHHLHLVVAPTKNRDRYEWFLEKATEIGLQEITPILCARSERKSLNSERMQKILLSAMKQSLQAYLPKLNPGISFTDFLPTINGDQKFIAHCQSGEKAELKRRLAPDKDVVILIGPEGDFNPDEIDQAYTSGCIPVSLGKNRLRTETAALVACTLVNSINNG